jgi:hypothetical protein
VPKTMLENILELPKSVKSAFLSFFIAWAAHFFTVYLYILKEDPPYKQLVLGGMIFMALIFAKKWGRVVCIFFTSWAIVWYLWFVVSFYFAKRFDIIAILAGNIFLFSTSIYFLWQKETAQYFSKRAEDEKAKIERRAQEYSERMNVGGKQAPKKKKSGPKKKR